MYVHVNMQVYVSLGTISFYIKMFIQCTYVYIDMLYVNVYFLFFVTHFVEYVYKSIHMDFCFVVHVMIDVKGEFIFI